MDKKEGEVSRFFSKLFCLTVPEDFVEEPFYAVFQKRSGSGKVFGKEGGGDINISFENFCSSVPKNAVWELFSLSITSGSENFLDKSEREVSIFPSPIFFLIVPKNSVGAPFCAVFQKISGSQKFMDKKEGDYQVFFQDFLSYSTTTFRRGTLLCCVSETFW